MRDYDPLSDVEDTPLFIVPRVLDGLLAFGKQPRLAKLPDADTCEERARLEPSSTRRPTG